MRPGADIVRPRSCPPLVEAELRHWYSPQGFTPHVGPEVLTGYTDVKCLYEPRSTALYRLDGNLCLKLYPPLYDIEDLVLTMRLASQVVPVPRVHSFGRSGNCCYTVTDWISGDGVRDLRHVMADVPKWIVTARVEKSLRPIIDGLRRLGIAHNDLYPRNMFIDRYWRVCGVIDWDMANYAMDGQEYRGRLLSDYRSMSHEWDYMFLAPCRPFGCGLVVCDGDNDIEPADGCYYRPLLHKKERFGLTDAVAHGLDPLDISIDIPRPEPRVIILSGGDGRRALHLLDDHAMTVNGLSVARIFTEDAPSQTLRQRGINITPLADAPRALDRFPEDELARLAVRELATFVFLVDWKTPLGMSFLEGHAVPIDLAIPEAPGAMIVRFDTQVAPDEPPSPERRLRHRSTLLYCESDAQGNLTEHSYVCMDYCSLPLDVDDQTAVDRVTASMERDAAVAIINHYLPQYMLDQPQPATPTQNGL